VRASKMIRELVDVYLNSGIVRIELRGADKVESELPAEVPDKVKRGFELIEDFRIGYEKIIEYQWLERRSDSIRQVPKDLYLRARLTIQECLARGGEKEVRQIQAGLRELVQLRLKKILSAIAMNPDLALTREFLEKLTLEEEVLTRQIAKIVKEWLEYVLGLV